MAAIKAKRSANPSPERPQAARACIEVFAYFVRLGFLGFGGPFAVMAALQKDLIEERRWMPPERFAQVLALIKALPGPVATQLCIYLGFVRAGRVGGLIAGTALIAPAFAMMVAIAAFYSSLESFAWTKPILFGMQAAAIGVIFESICKLGRPYAKEAAFWFAAFVSAALTFWRPSYEPAVIVGAGALGMLALRVAPGNEGRRLQGVSPAVLGAASAAATALPVLTKLAGVSLKAGALVFGTGLAIVPLLAHEVVDTHGWLTRPQFMDALAFGQITPGPVVITVTFIGYKVAGFWGALTATIGIFAPAFFNILTWFPVVEKKFAGSPYTKRFIVWALAAVVGSIVVAVSKLAASTALTGSPATLAAIAFFSFAVMLLTRIPVWAIIPGGGAIAALLALF